MKKKVFKGVYYVIKSRMNDKYVGLTCFGRTLSLCNSRTQIRCKSDERAIQIAKTFNCDEVIKRTYTYYGFLNTEKHIYER